MYAETERSPFSMVLRRVFAPEPCSVAWPRVRIQKSRHIGLLTLPEGAFESLMTPQQPVQCPPVTHVLTYS